MAQPIRTRPTLSLSQSLPSRSFHKPLILVYQRVAAAKSLQSCPTLCDPIDGRPPDFHIPGILQARALEWVAISFSNEWKWKVKVKSLSRVRLLATPWTAAHQASRSMGFSRQDYWSGVPLPSPLSEGRQTENHNHGKLTNLITWTTALSNSMQIWAMLCRATQDGRVMVESSDKTWSTGEGNGKPLQYSCLENAMNCMKRPKKKKKKKKKKKMDLFS